MVKTDYNYFPIPNPVIPEEYFCLCLRVPNDPTYKQVLARVLNEQTYWFNWERNPEKEGKIAASVWKEIYDNIDWSTMSCCCEETAPLKTRFDDEGHYQTSDDGGVTWIDAPTEDIRYSAPEFPPGLPPGTISADCTYADSIVTIFKEQFVDAVEVGDNVTAIAAVLAGIVGAILGPLSWAVIYVIAAALFPAILAFTVEAWQAAFDADVWDRLRCNLRDNMSADGSFTQAQIDTVYENLSITESGIALFTLQRVVATFGATGMTNAARSGLGAEDADCGPCDPICSALPFIADGENVVYDECQINVDAHLTGATYSVYLWAGNHPEFPLVYDPDACLQVFFWEVTSGLITQSGWSFCGGGSGGSAGFPLNTNGSQFFWASNVPFSLSIVVAPPA